MMKFALNTNFLEDSRKLIEFYKGRKKFQDDLNNFEEAFIDYSFTPTQKSKYLHNLFETKEKIFCRKNLFAGFIGYLEYCGLFLEKLTS